MNVDIEGTTWRFNKNEATNLNLKDPVLSVELMDNILQIEQYNRYTKEWYYCEIPLTIIKMLIDINDKENTQ